MSYVYANTSMRGATPEIRFSEQLNDIGYVELAFRDEHRNTVSLHMNLAEIADLSEKLDVAKTELIRLKGGTNVHS